MPVIHILIRLSCRVIPRNGQVSLRVTLSIVGKELTHRKLRPVKGLNAVGRSPFGLKETLLDVSIFAEARFFYDPAPVIIDMERSQ
jgi:hypothetical protein